MVLKGSTLSFNPVNLNYLPVKKDAEGVFVATDNTTNATTKPFYRTYGR